MATIPYSGCVGPADVWLLRREHVGAAATWTTLVFTSRICIINASIDGWYFHAGMLNVTRR